MSNNITDIIEQYLKKILHAQEDKMIEIRRNEIADQFQCVPSQINYVINTRFTAEKGYMIESKRGGGGYIRIFRIEHQDKAELIDEIIKLIDKTITQKVAENILARLLEKDVITEREEMIMLSAIDRKTLAFKLPLRDELRAHLLKAMLTKLKFASK